MTALKAEVIVLALAATGAWAQDPPVASMTTLNATKGLESLRLDTGITLSEGVQLSGKNIDLSPDQKLARAYALCVREGLWTRSTKVPCDDIFKAWQKSSDTDADRAFIEEVARGLK